MMVILPGNLATKAPENLLGPNKKGDRRKSSSPIVAFQGFRLLNFGGCNSYNGEAVRRDPGGIWTINWPLGPSRAAAWWFQISHTPGSSNIALAGKWRPRMKSQCIFPIKTGDIPLVCLVYQRVSSPLNSGVARADFFQMAWHHQLDSILEGKSALKQWFWV